MTNGWEQLAEKKEEVKETKETMFKNLSEVGEKRGLKIGIYGDFATGKTHFALTCPEPIYIIDTENGSAPLAHSFKGKDIKVLDVCEEDGSKSYDKIVEAINYIINQENVGTVVIDSVSDLWDFAQENAKVKVFKISVLERLKQQWDWGTINKMYLSLLLKLINKNCNLILTARESEVYAGAGQPTNIVKPKWQKATGYWMDLVLYADKKITKEGTTFISTIEKSRQFKDLMGKQFYNLTYQNLLDEINKLKGGQNGNQK